MLCQLLLYSKVNQLYIKIYPFFFFQGSFPIQVITEYFLNDHFNFLKFIDFCLCGVSFAVRAFSSCGQWRLLSSCGAQASRCRGFFCCRAQALGRLGFSSCGAWAQLLWGMQDLPRSGVEPMSPALQVILCHWATRKSPIHSIEQSSL